MTTARSLLVETHPVHAAFVAWAAKRNQEPSKRQAARFLQSFPQYRKVVVVEAEAA
ncbi:MAG: hypothetical protein ACYSW3_22490 [Planctomycetota bacterium]|jgi:hypothetical protein